MTRRTARLLRLVSLLSLAIAMKIRAAPGDLALELRPLGEVFFPLDHYTDSLSGALLPLYAPAGIGAGLALEPRRGEGLAPFIRGYYLSVPLAGGGGSLGIGEGDLGLGLRSRPWERGSLRFDAMGGVAEILYPGGSGLAFAAGLRAGIGYRITPAFRLSADAGYSSYFGTKGGILNGFSAGLRLSFDLSAIAAAAPRVVVDQAKLDAVFPSLYAYYDEAPFGTVRVTNGEDENIHDVRVSFNAAGYMAQPKLCSTFSSIARGASVTVPIRALFDDRVLEITQGFEAKGEIIVEYEYVGSTRTMRWPVDFRMHHRNAITWSDDRRAASFVSATNPAALWFSRFAASVVRDRLRGEVNRPLQYAVGMFEAERLYGLNYVVVPANDYSVKHELKDYIDSVQFPHQTLQNRGGDCSDLAILFASLMESVGVEAAFITIPGHIFAAFDTGLGAEEAAASFYDPQLLIYKGGKAWIPVEITMVQDGFIKAWRVGAKEWYDNEAAKTAAFYPLSDCWPIYPPASVPGIDPRFVLPGEADLAKAYDLSLDRFVAREIESEVSRRRIADAALAPAAAANEMGVLFARFGMLKQAWASFSEGAKGGSTQAWTNLANVAFLQKDYKLALGYYDYVAKLDARDSGALLGRARCEYELGDFAASDADYTKLRVLDPELASRFGYLASIYGGQGRAFSLADRARSVEWAASPRPAPAAIASLAPTAGAPGTAAAPADRSTGNTPRTAREPELVAASPAPAAAIGLPQVASTEDDTGAGAELSSIPAPAAITISTPTPTPTPATGSGPTAAPEPTPTPAPEPVPAQTQASTLDARPTPKPGPEPSTKNTAPSLEGPEAQPSAVGVDIAEGGEAAAPPGPATAMASGPRAGGTMEPQIGSPSPEVDLPATDLPAPTRGRPEEGAPASPQSSPTLAAAPESAAEATPSARSAGPPPGVASPEPAMPAPEVAAPKIAEELPTDLDIAEKEAEQRRVAALSDTTGAPAAPSPAPVAVVEPAAAATALAATPPNEPSASPPMPSESSATLQGPPAAPNAGISSPAEPPPPPPEPALAISPSEPGPKSPEQPPEPASPSPPEQPPAPTEQLLALGGQEPRSDTGGTKPAGPEASHLPEPAPSDLEEAGEPVAPITATESIPRGSGEASGEEPGVTATLPAPAEDRVEREPAPTPAPSSESAESRPPAPAIALAFPPEPSSPTLSPPSREGSTPPAKGAGAGTEVASSSVQGSHSEQQSPAAEEEEIPLAQGFGGSTALLGEWRVTDNRVKQLDKDAFFAKLAAPLVQEPKSYRYSFVASSEARGRGWVGLGATVFVPSSGLVKGYGSGNALLVWLTRDPVHFAKDITRLQIYRSVNEWKMILVAEIPVSESIYDDNRFEISMDPVAGTISVSLNGKHYLTATGMDGLEAGSYVVFRSLDQASFGDFTARLDGTGAGR